MSSAAMLDKMRDALKRAAQSLQAVKEENKRLHDQLDDANATIMELQIELSALKKQHDAGAQDEATSPPPTKRAKAAQARQQTKKSQLSSAVQSWLGPGSLLPSLPPAAPEEIAIQESDTLEMHMEAVPPSSPEHQDLLPAEEDLPMTAAQSTGFFSGRTTHDAFLAGSDTSEDEGIDDDIAPTENVEPQAPDLPSMGEGSAAVDVPRTTHRSQFVSKLLKQLTIANYARVGHHLATDKRAQSVDLIVAELMSFLREQCHGFPQPFADYIHQVISQEAVPAQAMLTANWLSSACEKARTLPARQQLIDAANCVVNLVLSISQHPSKGLLFYDTVTDGLSRELLKQCMSKNVVGLKTQSRDNAEVDDDDHDGYEEYLDHQHTGVAVQEPEDVPAVGAELCSDTDSDDLLNIEVMPGGSTNVGDDPIRGVESPVHSQVASVFAELDLLSDSDSDDGSVPPFGHDVSSHPSNGESIAPAPEAGVPSENAPSPKLQQTTLRKERADWRTTLLTVVVFMLHKARPLQTSEKQLQILVWDILKSCMPHVPSGFLYGMALACPDACRAIDLAPSFGNASSSTSAVVGLCVLACFRQVLTTAAKRPRERFWLFRLLGFLAELDSHHTIELAAVVNTLLSTDQLAFYTAIVSQVKLMVTSTMPTSSQDQRAAAKQTLQSTLHTRQLTKQLLTNSKHTSLQHAPQQDSDGFESGFHICCRSIGFVPTLQVLDELGVFESMFLQDQLQCLFTNRELPWHLGNGTVMLNRALSTELEKMQLPDTLLGGGLVERSMFDMIDVSKLNSGLAHTERSVRSAETLLRAVAAWSVVTIDLPQGNAAGSSSTLLQELGLSLSHSHLSVADNEDLKALNISVTAATSSPERVEVVLYQSQYREAPGACFPPVSVSGAFSGRQLASVPVVALLRVRCLLRAFARKLLVATPSDHTSGHILFSAARYLLFFDDQTAAVRGDILDEMLSMLRSVHNQVSGIQIPRSLLMSLSHMLTTRAVGHVINLDRRSDRWHRMMKMAQTCHLTLYRHAALDGGKGDPGISDREVTFAWNSFVNAKFDEKSVASTSVTLSPSERACAASHLQLWRDFDSGKLCGLQPGNFHSPFVLIFEDDAKVRADNFVERLAEILTQLPSNFDICYLGCIIPSNAKRIKWSQQLVVPEYAWQLHAYLLSRAGVRKLLAQLPISAPVDNFVAELAMAGNLHAFAVKQSMVTQLKVVNKQAARGSIDTDIRHSGRIVGTSV